MPTTGLLHRSKPHRHSIWQNAAALRHPQSAGDTLVTSFMAKCDQVMLAEGYDRTEAMRRVRKRHEGLFDAFQLV